MDQVLSWAGIIIPSFVTIVGLIVSYYQNKKTIADEIMKSKRILMVEKGMSVFEQVILLLDTNKMQSFEQEDFNNILNQLYVYGSKNAITLFADFQQYNYQDQEIKDKMSKYQPFAYLCLLLVQLKLDVSGEVIKPTEILRIRITDYETNSELKHELPNLINQLVDKYHLNDGFRC